MRNTSTRNSRDTSNRPKKDSFRKSGQDRLCRKALSSRSNQSRAPISTGTRESSACWGMWWRTKSISKNRSKRHSCQALTSGFWWLWFYLRPLTLPAPRSNNTRVTTSIWSKRFSRISVSILVKRPGNLPCLSTFNSWQTRLSVKTSLQQQIAIKQKPCNELILFLLLS